MTDNNTSNAKNKPINQQIQEFCQTNYELQSKESEKPSVIKKEVILEPEDGCELAQMFAEFNASKLPSGTECVFNPAESELVLTIDSNGQTAGKTVLPPVFETPDIANCPVEEGKNCDEALILGKTEVLTDAGKTAENDEMSTPVPVFQQEDAGAVSGYQKTLVDASLLASQNKSIDEFCLDKSAFLANKTTDNNADAGQQTVLSIAELSESLRDKDEGRVANNAQNDSLLKELNSEQIISINETKDKDSSSTTNSNFQDSSTKTFKQIFSVNGAQYSVMEQSSAAASVSKMANTALPSDVSTNISKQIQESIHSSLRQGEQQITIRLDPPELGKVSIKFHEQDGQIVGLLEVSKAQTRTEIQQALPQIIQNLVENGVQVKRLEVLLTNQQEQQGFKDPSLATGADEWSGQGQAGANSDSQGDNPAWVKNGEWLINDQSYANFIEPGMQITDDSINILV